MGVGRNLLYKNLFIKGNNFDSHLHIPHDDDLFVNQVATAHNSK